MFDCDRINAECFWDYSFTNDEILMLSQSKNEAEKKFLFEKILLNSTQMFQDLEIFSKEDLNQLLSDFKVLKFNYNYIFKRKNLAEVYFLDRELLIDELKWVS